MSISRLAPAVLLGFALVGCGFTAPLPESGVPSVLEFSLGGFGYGSRSVLVRGDTVVTWSIPRDFSPGARIDTVRVVPTSDAWRAFWFAANEAGVHQWRSEYRAEGIVDGSGWSLRLVADGREIRSQGSNAYPDRNGREHRGSPTPEFSAMLSAFDQLAGQKVF